MSLSLYTAGYSVSIFLHNNDKKYVELNLTCKVRNSIGKIKIKGKFFTVIPSLVLRLYWKFYSQKLNRLNKLKNEIIQQSIFLFFTLLSLGYTTRLIVGSMI